ncbi:hypothetical protein MNBD_BACTEROID05-532 [hydrothermal vent metagenome]|uniref:YtkA-like domain-containing protein n=1 Tax=hydrothermal vent metagenome TaxID=652676 RepID=A0A3B0TMU5_9ZZZZ
MKSIKIFLFLLFFSIIVLSGTKVFANSNFSVEMKTTPTAQSIGPDLDFVHTTLTVKDNNGSIVNDAYVRLHIHSPKGNKIFSTDFPWVENTHLIAYEGYVNNGSLEFDYIYPIRGKYRVDVQAGINPSTLSEKQSLSLSVHENPIEFRSLLIFIALLLGFGVIAGFIIGRGAPMKEAAFASLILMLSIGITPSIAFADHPAHGQDAASIGAFTENATNEGINLDFTMNPGAGKVGMLNELTLTAKNSDGQFIANTNFDVKLWHIEDDKPVFSTVLFGKNGQANLNFQFFDGAEHEVRIIATNLLGSVSLARIVEVEGIHPPISTKVKTTIYFTLIVFLGIIAGLRLQRKPQLKVS